MSFQKEERGIEMRDKRNALLRVARILRTHKSLKSRFLIGKWTGNVRQLTAKSEPFNRPLVSDTLHSWSNAFPRKVSYSGINRNNFPLDQVDLIQLQV